MQSSSKRKAEQAMAFLEENELTGDMKEKLIEKVAVYLGTGLRLRGGIKSIWGTKYDMKISGLY